MQGFNSIKNVQLNNLKYPFAISFNITQKCNLKCLHCYNNSGEENKSIKELSDEELIYIANQIAQINPKSVCICGGEPLVRKDILKEIIKILSESCGQVNMVSNGYLLNESLAKELKECGLNLIQFSLDGANSFQHDSFRGKLGSFNKVIEAIKISVKNNLAVAISYVPNKINHISILDLIDLCGKLKVQYFRSMPLIPMGRGSLIENLLLDSNEYIALQQKLEYARSKYLGIIDIEWGDPMDHLYRMPFNASQDIKTYSVEIRSDGKIVLTTYLPIVIGDLLEKNLKEYWNEGIKDIWKNEEVLELISGIENIYDFNRIYGESEDIFINNI